MTVRNPIQPGDGDPRHGTIGGYSNHRCRCPLCTEANRVDQARYLRAHPEQVRIKSERELAAYYAGRRARKPPGRQP